MTLTVDRASWLESRRRGIGASDIAAVAGLSPFGTPYSVWAEKTGRTFGSDESEVMRWGQLLEPVILAEFGDRQEVRTAYAGMIFHREVEWAFASPDAFVVDRAGVPVATVDAKATGAYRWEEPPDHYAIQVQWQLYVTGLPVGWLAVLHGGRRMEIYQVDADPQLQADLVELAGRFWSEHVQADEPPPVDGSRITSDTLSSVFRGAGGEVELVGDALAAFTNLGFVTRQLRALDERKRLLENRVKAELGEATVGLVAGKPAVRWTPITSKRIDATRIKAERPDVWEEFQSESSYRRFTLVGGEGGDE